jgi:hypothetical protein
VPGSAAAAGALLRRAAALRLLRLLVLLQQAQRARRIAQQEVAHGQAQRHILVLLQEGGRGVPGGEAADIRASHASHAPVTRLINQQ